MRLLDNISPFGNWYWPLVFAVGFGYWGISDIPSLIGWLQDNGASKMNPYEYYGILALIIIGCLIGKLINIQVPRFKLSLHFIGDVVPMKNPRNLNQKLFDSKYVRIRVDSISGSSVEDCTAHLKSLLKLGQDGKFVKTEFEETYPLPWWHGYGAKPKTLIPEVEGYIDVAQTVSTQNRLALAETMPSKMENTFVDHTTYRFEIVVNGGKVSKSITIDVDWEGQWDTLTAKEAK